MSYVENKSIFSGKSYDVFVSLKMDESRMGNCSEGKRCLHLTEKPENLRIEDKDEDKILDFSYELRNSKNEIEKYFVKGNGDGSFQEPVKMSDIKRPRYY